MSKESRLNEWVEEKGVWVYRRWVEEPKKLPKRVPDVCPECGSNSIWSTCIGYFICPPFDEHDHDPNRKTCNACGCVFHKPCPVCGATKNLEREE